MSIGNGQTLSGLNLRKVYGNREIVKGISITVNRGEVVGLLGPNGAGKTTTFYMITGMIRPNSGAVILNDSDITKLPMYKHCQNGGLENSSWLEERVVNLPSSVPDGALPAFETEIKP